MSGSDGHRGHGSHTALSTHTVNKHRTEAIIYSGYRGLRCSVIPWDGDGCSVLTGPGSKSFQINHTWEGEWKVKGKLLKVIVWTASSLVLFTLNSVHESIFRNILSVDVRVDCRTLKK